MIAENQRKAHQDKRKDDILHVVDRIGKDDIFNEKKIYLMGL